MTANQFRRIALGLSGASEGAHMGHPDFRAANGRIFGSLLDEGKTGTAALTADQQARFIDDAPEVFAPAAGAWGRQGWTTIRLAKAKQELVGEALTLAWQNIAAKRPAAKKPARKR